MLSINTNVTSQIAQNNLTGSQSALQTSLQRLSSGLRINSAKDDAAGLAISSRMTSQINGLNQAVRNANDGISLSQTAEGAMSSIGDNLQRMRELTVQAANGTNSASDRASIQAEVSQLQQEINRVANTTQFNGQNILDGSLSNAQFQVGANANQTINFGINSVAASAIGNNKVSANAATAATTLTEAHLSAATGAFDPNTLLAQNLTIQGNGSSVSVAVAVGLSDGLGGTAKSVADSVNAASGTTGVTAQASTTATLAGFVSGTVSLTLEGAPNGTPPAANKVTVSATLGSANDVSGLASAINAQTGSTGITAVADTVTGKIALTQSQGYDIGVQNNTAQAAITMTGTTSAGAAGTAVTLAAAGTGGDVAVVGGAVTFNGPNAFTVASDTATSGIFDTANAAVSSGLTAVSAVDVTKMTNGIPTGANNALAVIDSAINNINSSRAALGAVQNRFTSTISNLQSSATNIGAARSRIQDTDFAAETANMTRNQILQQAGTAMLAQANALPNSVLSLLK